MGWPSDWSQSIASQKWHQSNCRNSELDVLQEHLIPLLRKNYFLFTSTISVNQRIYILKQILCRKSGVSCNCNNQALRISICKFASAPSCLNHIWFQTTVGTSCSNSDKTSEKKLLKQMSFNYISNRLAYEIIVYDIHLNIKREALLRWM